MTEEAGNHLSKLLDDEKCESGTAIRLVIDDEGVGMELSQETPEDTPLAHNGRTVILLDKDVLPLLNECRLEIDSETSQVVLIRDELDDA